MFVFPMAGLSSRFTSAGYNVPKYMLPAGDRSLFEHALSGFNDYYESETFLFIYLRGRADSLFIVDACEKRGIPRHNILLAELPCPTNGQASTVAQGLEKAGVPLTEPLTIFNIDSTYRLFKHPAFAACEDIAGYIDVFKADGDHWSFVLAEGPEEEHGPVAKVAEKERISDLCSTGLYHFSHALLFLDAYEASKIDGLGGREHYVAPLYNRIIEQGKTVLYRLVSASDIAFSGTPDEYSEFLKCMPFNYG